MEFLDKEGVATLWSKIKSSNNYLKVTGGEMSGQIKYANQSITEIQDQKTIQFINSVNYIQGQAVFGNYLFQAYIGGKYIDVIDLTTYEKTALLTISIDEDFNAYHGNTISFGREIPDDSSFPYLYYSCENNTKPCINVIKITTASDGKWTGTVVQVIYLPSSSGGKHLDSTDDTADPNFSHYFQNGCIDPNNSCIWVYGYTKNSYYDNSGEYGGNELVYRKYYLPSVTSGNVYFGSSDVEETFTLPFISGTQGSYIENNLFFQIIGYNPNSDYTVYFVVVDLNSHECTKKIKIPIAKKVEVEGSFSFKDNQYIVQTKYGSKEYTISKIPFSDSVSTIIDKNFIDTPQVSTDALLIKGFSSDYIPCCDGSVILKSSLVNDLNVDIRSGDGANSVVINNENNSSWGDFSCSQGSETMAQGYCSHAEGNNTTAEGDNSHAEGSYTSASGSNSHAEGYQTSAICDCGHAEGIYNKPNAKSIHQVGIGFDDSKRRNAEEIYRNPDNQNDYKNGYKYIIGIGGYDGTNAYSNKGALNMYVQSVQEVINGLQNTINQLKSRRIIYDTSEKYKVKFLDHAITINSDFANSVYTADYIVYDKINNIFAAYVSSDNSYHKECSVDGINAVSVSMLSGTTKSIAITGSEETVTAYIPENKVYVDCDTDEYYAPNKTTGVLEKVSLVEELA